MEGGRGGWEGEGGGGGGGGSCPIRPSHSVYWTAIHTSSNSGAVWGDPSHL